MRPLSFEKDDDENGHIDFMTAASVSHTHYQIQWDFNYKFTLLIVIVLRGKGWNLKPSMKLRIWNWAHYKFRVLKKAFVCHGSMICSITMVTTLYTWTTLEKVGNCANEALITCSFPYSNSHEYLMSSVYW